MKNLRHQFITHKVKAVCVLFLFLIPKKSLSQDSTCINYYRELNFGVSFNDWMPFPGSSYLWGQTIHFDNVFFADIQACFALPSIVTAKLGIGISPFKNNEVSIIFGLRPFPVFTYSQLNIKTKNGVLIFSYEYGQSPWSPNIRGTPMVNIGIRNNVTKNYKLKRNSKSI